MTTNPQDDPSTETTTQQDGVQVPRTAVLAQHSDPRCPQYGEIVRWPVDSINGIYALPNLHCETCVGELRRMD